MIKNMVIRDLKVKYQRSLLGFLWTLLNPLLLFVIYIIVFSQVVRLEIPHYWAFLLSGLFAWNFFAQSIVTASNAIRYNANLTTRIYFPQEVLIVSSVLSKLVEFGLELFILLGIFLIFYPKIYLLNLFFLPVVVLIQTILIIGLVFPLSCLMVFFKDMEHILSLLMTGWFFLTPIFYPDFLIPTVYLKYFELNPMFDLISLYRSLLYQGELPDVIQLFRSCSVSILFFLVGYNIFNRYKALFAEVA